MAMRSYTLCRPQILASARNTLNLFITVLLGLLFFQGPVFADAPENAPYNGTNKVYPPPERQSPSPTAHENHGKGKFTLGETVYKHMCIFCHGQDGNGGGKAMAYLYPWPRDFRKGVFKHRSTPTGSLPLDEDIYQTITRGVPGTSMPAWGDALSEDEARSVAQYIKNFSKRFAEEKPEAPVAISSVPPTTPEQIKKGKDLFDELRCSRCHGTDLKGGGPLSDELYDIWDHRVFIYDLTNPNTFKFGFTKRDLFLTLTTGLDGTPMKAYNNRTDEERWALAAFVRSNIQDAMLQDAKYETDLKVKKTENEIDLDPDNPLWDEVPVQKVHMLPLSARTNPVNQIKFQSVTNEEGIAFRLEWEDAIADRSSSRHQDFKDAVALEFALGDVLLHTHGHNEPFFGMGNRGKVVNIWQWRADWQTEIETKEKLEYATKGLDLDTMIFGGEVNPVDALNPFRDVPVEELNAEGFGTLTPQPQTKQNVLGKGVWRDGKWQIVFYRALDSLNKWDIKFKSKQPVLIAFAVWDGAHQDRNGRKVVSMWQRFHLNP
jgi:mono/diheme cytochrome c family protein